MEENRPGKRGPIGDTGLTGKTGAPGKTGESGERGAPGVGGDSGGAVGETGRTGARGAQGATGETGQSGARGAPGTSGDQESRRITNSRLARSDRHIGIVFVIAMLAVLGIGWGLDYQSCVRQAVPEQVLRDFLVTAAQTRETSSRHERGLQSRLDHAAFVQWTYDAGRLRIHDKSACLAVLPPTQ